MRCTAALLLTLVAAQAYEERLHLIPYSRTNSLAAFSFEFSHTEVSGAVVNTKHFPAFLPELLTISHMDSFSLSLVQGQTEPFLGEVLSEYNAVAGTQFAVREAGLYFTANADAIWSPFAAVAAALVCSPLSAFEPVRLPHGLYLHAHDFNCKENLVAVLKLLPCRDSRGLGQLLTDSLYSHGYMAVTHSASRRDSDYVYRVEVLAEVSATSAFHPRTSSGCLQSTVSLFSADSTLVTTNFTDTVFPELKTAAISPVGQCVELQSERRLGGELHNFESVYQHTIDNCFPDTVSVTLYEFFPAPVTPLLHSLQPSHGHWSVQRAGRGWLLTITARVDAGKRFTARLRVVKQMQQFEQYPNDPQRGWDIPSMPIRYELLGTPREQFSQRLLVMVPEPDFSMPFNVMCVTGVLISFFFTTIQTFTLSKAKTHWSSPRYLEEVVKAEKVQNWARRLFLCVSLGTVYLLDRYGIVKLFG